MRSVQPIPGDPWPHEMMITVEDQPTALLELLWIREAFGLRPGGDDHPPPLVRMPAPARTVLDDCTRNEWQETWAEIWRDVAAHAGRENDPRLFERIRQASGASAERASLLRQIIGPTWDDRFGRDAFDDASYRDWDHRSAGDLRASHLDPLQNSPERRDLEALVRAWRAGLTKIVTIPARDEYTSDGSARTHS